MHKAIENCAIALIASTLTCSAAFAQNSHATTSLSSGPKFPYETGEELYQNTCAGCHQHDGSGAVGAGYYPALSGNENLEYPGYPIYIILNGKAGMPPFADWMDDEQIAALVTYIQTNIGNNYTEENPTAQNVADSR